ncbi:hypothetical protein [Salarchaeum japonicum]|uniref:Uncharacterized protein n=1 Tax=Salarchaeum japonicum TaxID=555573 RepID=A0AAV3SZP0_9EURY|nr:hypothetical protein [Salarchaeum japonicum]
MSDEELSRAELADIVENADTLFVVAETENGNWGTYRDTTHHGSEGVASCLSAAITARDDAREFLDAVSEDDPELVAMAEDVFADVNGGVER